MDMCGVRVVALAHALKTAESNVCLPSAAEGGFVFVTCDYSCVVYDTARKLRWVIMQIAVFVTCTVMRCAKVGLSGATANLCCHVMWYCCWLPQRYLVPDLPAHRSENLRSGGERPRVMSHDFLAMKYFRSRLFCQKDLKPNYFWPFFGLP